MSTFGLVVDNKVVVGPRDWRYFFFKEYCEENGLDYSVIPSKKEDNLPIYGTGFSILPVVETIYPVMGQFDQLAGPELTITADSITETYTAVPKPLDTCKGEVKAVLAANRFAKEVKDLAITLQGTPVIVEADRLNKMMIINIFGLMGLEDVFNFKFPKSGNWVALTKTDMAAMVAAIVGQTQDAFDWEKGIADTIDAATDYVTLGAIDIGNIAPFAPLV